MAKRQLRDRNGRFTKRTAKGDRKPVPPYRRKQIRQQQAKLKQRAKKLAKASKRILDRTRRQKVKHLGTVEYDSAGTRHTTYKIPFDSKQADRVIKQQKRRKSKVLLYGSIVYIDPETGEETYRRTKMVSIDEYENADGILNDMELVAQNYHDRKELGLPVRTELTFVSRKQKRNE